MDKGRQIAAFLFFAAGWSPATIHAQQTVLLPKPSVCVSDKVHALTGPATTYLNALCADVERQTGTQMVVVTMHSTGGMAVPEYARDLVHAWRLGERDSGRGVMVLASVGDCHWSLLATQQLATTLPAATLDAIGYRMQQYLRVSQNDEGVILGAQTVAALLAAHAGVTLQVKPIVLPRVGRPAKILGRKQAAVTGGALLLLLILVWRLRISQWLACRVSTQLRG